MARKIALYTVITNSYDTLNPIPRGAAAEIDCFVVTDDPSNIAEGWKQILIDRADDPHRQQRALKIDFTLIPELNGYDTIIYIDANMSLRKPLQGLLRYYRGGLLTIKHPNRNCVYEEGWACIDLKKAKKEDVLSQLSSYQIRGIRPGTGMYQTGLMIRDRSDVVIGFCKEWLSELNKHTHRDQLSIIAARDKAKITIATINMGIFNTHISIGKHKSKTRPIIHYLTPYSTEKNIGKAYNDAIRQLNAKDEDWVVIRDGDTLFPTPNWGLQISDAIMAYGENYGLIGAVTNRIGDAHQRVPDMFEVWDFREHVKKAMELEGSEWGNVREIQQGVAGFLMAFQVKTWKVVKFIETNDTGQSKIFDTIFNKGIRAAKLKIGLMTGLYVLHLYRPLSDNPRSDIKHLI
ncbi:DUF616 domain-containing protein [Sphingobacterium sp. SGG-5]|uniref:glycosyltransferase domain-containing protein n=1 Tax=Sphingobacterium sp. SGG-5 TaxID=2710881 RepID=UPI0013EC4D38|nr:glycosyltransferase domain-containing protein [Sphingobacterium sp. SGG-5]NGM63497.1 DUF616 domain-containing protein [Sphingobacterium sp. SGG-5]